MDSSLQTINLLYSHNETFEVRHDIRVILKTFKDYDFIKKIEPCYASNEHLIATTENGYLNGYTINNDNSQFWIKQTFSNKFGTHLYDVTSIPTSSGQIEDQNGPQSLLAISSKDNPVTFATLDI